MVNGEGRNELVLIGPEGVREDVGRVCAEGVEHG